MEFLKPGPNLAPLELRAMTMVGRAATSGLARPQRAMLDATQRLLFETDLELESLASITPLELASELRDPAESRQLIRLMVEICLADGTPSREQIRLLEAFSAALRVKEPAVGVIRYLVKNNVLRFRLAFMRHSHLRTYLRNTYRSLGGILPMLDALLVAGGKRKENAEMVGRFHALESLPEGTLGHEFFRHYTQEGLAFPGQKGGFPVGALYHDFSHVISGYDTSPEGELKNAAFQAGFTKHEKDDFFVALFAIVIHTAGINMTPFEMPVKLGRIGDGTLALERLHALQRGAAMKTDLADNWNFWDYVELPIDVARERLGVLPIDEDLLSA